MLSSVPSCMLKLCPLISTAPHSCPAGFLKLDGRCYRYSPTGANHADASAACLKLASSLAQIDTAERAVRNLQ